MPASLSGETCSNGREMTGYYFQLLLLYFVLLTWNQESVEHFETHEVSFMNRSIPVWITHPRLKMWLSWVPRQHFASENSFLILHKSYRCMFPWSPNLRPDVYYRSHFLPSGFSWRNHQKRYLIIDEYLLQWQIDYWENRWILSSYKQSIDS